jgi:hypothetical protein
MGAASSSIRRNSRAGNIWSGITTNSCLSGQAFSDDRGKTWEVNWIAIDTRIKMNRKERIELAWKHGETVPPKQRTDRF